MSNLRKRIADRLRSERGASLSAALLLFLVCTVVASIVIVAGTAAAGRLQNLVYMDQRYYAVNSAAELLSKQFDEAAQLTNGVTVRLTRIDTAEEDLDGGTSTPTEGTPTGTVTFGDSVPALIKKLVIQMVDATADASGNGQISDASSQWNATTPCTESINLEFSLNVVEHTEANVDVTATSKEDGTIVLDLCNAANTDKGEYHLYVTLAPDFDVSEDSEDEFAVEGQTMTTTTTLTKETVMRWTVSSVTSSPQEV